MPTEQLLARNRSHPQLQLAEQQAGNLTKSPSSADTLTQFRAAKEQQMTQYRGRIQWHERRRTYLVLGIIAAIVLGLAAFVLAVNATGDFYRGNTSSITPAVIAWTMAVLLFATPIPLIRLRRQETKSAGLLSQLIFELNRTLAERSNTLAQMKKDVLAVETNFLNNDDELYTKKYLWHPYLNYIRIKQWNKDISVHAFVPSELPTLWMQEHPFELDNDDSDFVYRNWAIKQKIRELYFATDFTKQITLTEIEEISGGNPVIVERMLRQKKISKGIKEFKRLAQVRYLTPAAKMRLVSFVDSVLAQRDYVEQSDAMQDLLRSKDVQIMKYTDDFWRVHRRSLKFYGFELLGALLVIPLVVLSIAVWALSDGLAAAGTFILGGAILSFAQMALVTTQLRDMKAKKLTPSLVSSLIAIRHNICADTVLDEEQVYQYERTFKAAEKRFMLTATEIEPVKIAKQNVSDKVTARLHAQMIALRTNKEAQAQVYYEKFNHYRRLCIKFSAIETFVALLMIPAAISLLVDPTGILISLAVLGIGTTIEILAFRRHIIYARRKELYLLIYQKMAVLLSDYRLFQHPDYIAAELTKLEDSIRRAAALDNIIDVDEQIGDISVVDLGAFDETHWDRLEVMQDSPTAPVVKPEVTLADLVSAPVSEPASAAATDGAAQGSRQPISPVSPVPHEQPRWVRRNEKACCDQAELNCDTWAHQAPLQSPFYCQTCCTRCKAPTCAEHRTMHPVYEARTNRVLRMGPLCNDCEPCCVPVFAGNMRERDLNRNFFSCHNCHMSVCAEHNQSPSKRRADALCDSCVDWAKRKGWDPIHRNRRKRAIGLIAGLVVAAFVLIIVITIATTPETGARARHNAIGEVATAESIQGIWRGTIGTGWRFYGDGTGERIWNASIWGDDIRDLFTWEMDDQGNLVIPATDIFRERTYAVRTDGGVLSLLSSRELSTGEVVHSDWNYRRVIESDQVLAADRSNLAQMLVGYWKTPNVSTINRGWMFIADGTGVQYHGAGASGAANIEWEITSTGRLLVTLVSGGHERQREYVVDIVDNALILNSVVVGEVSTHDWVFVRSVPWR